MIKYLEMYDVESRATSYFVLDKRDKRSPEVIIKEHGLNP